MENYKGNWEHNLFMFHHAAHFHDTKLYWNIPSCTRGIEFNFPADSMERRGFYAASHRESKVEFSLILVLQPIYFPCFRWQINGFQFRGMGWRLSRLSHQKSRSKQNAQKNGPHLWNVVIHAKASAAYALLEQIKNDKLE